MSEHERQSREQTLQAIKAWLESRVDRSAADLTPSSNLIDWLETAGVWDEFDFADLAWGLRVQIDPDEWRQLVGDEAKVALAHWREQVRRGLTLERFAEFFARQRLVRDLAWGHRANTLGEPSE